MMKIKLMELEMMKKQYIKKLIKVELEINKIKGVHNNDKITGVWRPISRGWT